VRPAKTSLARSRSLNDGQRIARAASGRAVVAGLERTGLVVAAQRATPGRAVRPLRSSSSESVDTPSHGVKVKDRIGRGNWETMALPSPM